MRLWSPDVKTSNAGDFDAHERFADDSPGEEAGEPFLHEDINVVNELRKKSGERERGFHPVEGLQEQTKTC